MKITQILYKQHIGRSIAKLWFVKRERVIQNTQAEQYLSRFGIEVKDPKDVLQPKQTFPRIKIEHAIFPRPLSDEEKPDWNARACLVFKDHNVLQEGLHQAQILTNTVCLPDNVSNHIKDSISDLPKYVDDIVKSIIYTSNIFDSYQQVLPKRKDPERPAWVFPRDYGITNSRKMHNLSRKLLQLCESLSGPDIARRRCLLYDAITKLNLDKQSDLIQFTLRSDVMVMAASPLKPMEVCNDKYTEIDLPSIHPMHYTISLGKTNFYRFEDIYPVNATSPWVNVHTIFVHYDPEEVKALTELPVIETQITGRTLIKLYTVAASCARQRFGSSVKELPEPVTVQCIQSDGQNYTFSVFQLNSLDINNASIKNYWSALPSLKLYQKAQYEDGRPIVEGYNPEVFKRIVAFYKNGD